jgi:proteasome assembly chaperone (PAC2) family protein
MMDKQERLLMKERPNLRQPYLVCGLDGWVDGGEAATGTVRYLTEKLGARRFARIPVDRFHVLQLPGQVSLRPIVSIEQGLLREHHFPRNEFFHWTNPDEDNDLILFLGTEPNLEWSEYANAIIDVAETFLTPRIYLLGGVLDKIPHTREPSVGCTCTSVELRKEMKDHAVEFTSYEGPGSFGTTLLHVCKKKGIEAVSFMARAAYYPEFNILVPRNPKSILALARRLNSLLHLNLDLSDLNQQAKEYEGKLTFMASQNPEFLAYIRELEKGYAEVRYEETLHVSPGEAVRIAEELLRENQEGS